MKKTLTSLLLGTLCASGMANAQAERVNFGIKDASSGTTIGGSLIPPAGTGWKRVQEGLSIEITKPGPSDKENTQIEAYLINLDQPNIQGIDRIAILKKNIESSYSTPDSLKIARLEIANDVRLKQCLRVHLILVRAAQDTSQQAWYSDQNMLSCTLNAINTAGIEVRYVQRYFAKQPDPSIAGKAKAVLDSVNLVDKK